MANKAYTPAELASNIAFQTAKKAMPGVVSTPAPLQSLLKPQGQQSQAYSTPSIPGVGLPQVNDPIKTAVETPRIPAVLPQTGVDTKKVSKDDFKQKVIAGKQAGFTSTQILQRYKDKGYTIEGINYDDFLTPTQQQGGEQKSILEDNIITDLGSGIGQSVANYGKLGKKAAIYTVNKIREVQGKPPLTEQDIANVENTELGKALDTITNWQSPEQAKSTAGKVGKTVGELGQAMVMPTGVSSIAKIPQVAKGMTKVPLLGKIAQGALQGVIGQDQYTLATEGRQSTGKERLTAGLLGGGLPIIGAGLVKAGQLPKVIKGASNWVAEGMVSSNLKNPDMRAKYISKVGQTPEKTLLDEGIVGSLSSQAKQISDKSYKSYNATREALKSIPTQVKSDEGLWITNKILEGVDESIPGIDEVIAPIKDMNQRFINGSASLNDLNDAKLMLARYENIYDQFGKVKKSGDEFEKKAIAKMYDKMKIELEQIGNTYGIDFKSMNKETQKREGLRGLMDRAVAREAGRDMIGLSDYILGGLTVVDPLTAIPLALGKKFFSSPKVSSKVAKFLYTKGDDVASNTSNINRSAVDGATKQGVNALPLKQISASPVTPGGLVEQSLVNQPKPTVKTPVSIREIGSAKNPGTTKGASPVPKILEVPAKPKVDTMKNMIELDTNPQYQKQTLQDTNYKRNVRGLETEYGTVGSVKFDNRYNPQEFTIDGVKYPAGEVNNFWKKIGADEAKATVISNKNSEIRSKLQAIWNGKENKVSGPQLRIVMEDLGIKSVKDIPDESLQTILDMSRKQTAPKVTPKTTTNTTPTPKANVPKPKVGLGKETLEQDNLIQEARKYKSADEFIKANGGVGDSIVKAMKEELRLENLTDELSRKANSYSSQGGLVTNKTPEYMKVKAELDSAMKEYRLFKTSELGKLVIKERNKFGIATRIKMQKGIINTKDQLKQIREQANKSTKKPIPGK